MARIPIWIKAEDANGDRVNGAKLYVYVNNTSTPVTSYTDAALTTPHSSPIVSSAAGIFAAVYVPAGTYRIQITDADDVALPGYPADDVLVADGSQDRLFETRAALAAANVDSTISVVSTLGNATAGDGGGGTFKRAASQPSHEARTQSADGAWWEFVPDSGTVSPMHCGAVGDGATNDHDAVEAAFAAAAALDVDVLINRTYGTNATLTITSAQAGIRIRGTNALGELETGTAALKALSPFTGSWVLTMGDQTVGGSSIAGGVEVTNMRIDVNDISSVGGASFWQMAYPSLNNVYVHGAATGYGVRMDGCFFPTANYLTIRRCGDSATSSGGGLALTNTTREQSDGSFIRPVINSCGNHALWFEDKEDSNATTGRNHRQQHHEFYGGEINDNLAGHNSGTSMNEIALIEGADSVVFHGTSFIAAASANIPGGAAALACIKLGKSGGDADSIRALTFDKCRLVTNVSGGHAIEFVDDVLESLHLAGPVRDGFKLLDLTGVTAGVAEITGFPDVGVAQFTDPNGLIRTVKGGITGLEPASSGTTFYAGSSEDAGKPVHIRWTKTGGTQTTMQFGVGTSENRVLVTSGNTFNLAPTASAPSNPVAGDLAVSDGTGSGFDSSSGAGLYRHSGSAWVFVG